MVSNSAIYSNPPSPKLGFIILQLNLLFWNAWSDLIRTIGAYTHSLCSGLLYSEQVEHKQYLKWNISQF